MATTTRKRFVVALIVLGVLGLGGFFAANAWLATDDAPAAFTASGDLIADEAELDETGVPPAGTWNVSFDSVTDAGVGYRIIEDVPVGEPQTVVARTQEVQGRIELDGTTLTSAQLSLPVESLASDNSLRDDIVADTYLEAGTYPTASLEVVEPVEIDVAEDAAGSTTFTVDAELTVHGVTDAVTVVGTAAWSDTIIELVGTVDVTLSQFGVERPELLGRSARDQVTVEFKLRFVPSD